MKLTKKPTKNLFLLLTLLVASATHAQKLLVPVPLAPPLATPVAPATANPLGVPLSNPVTEPERWTKEDLTLDEQYSTAKKEAQAALHEAKIECQTQASVDQMMCLSQAKNEYDREMAAINKRFGLPE